MKICLIVNPNAGKKQGISVASVAESRFRQAGIETVRLVSDHPGGTREIAEQLDCTELDGVIAVGGDGTLFDVINGLLAGGTQPVPIGQIPVGTGNSFIRDLDVHSVDDAIERIVAGRVRKIDLGRFSSAAGEYYFANLLGAGFVSNVAYRARKFKALGALSYVIGVIGEVAGLRTSAARLEIDGAVYERDIVFVEICNSRYTGGNMMMAPPALIDDGLLDIVVLNTVSRRTVLRLLPTIFTGRHIEAPQVELFRGREIHLTTDRPLALTPDGETFGETPIHVTTCQALLEIFG